MADLIGKVVLITGGSRGIGKAIAIRMSKIGATVAFTYRSNASAARNVAHQIEQSGTDGIALKVDVSNAKEVRNAVKTVSKQFGRIDILVNNAGIWKYGEIGKITERQWDETLDTNLKGTFLFTNEIVPIMKRQKGGRIINIASTAGQRGEPFHSHYAASKGGMIAFTKSIGAELAPFGIYVNCVSPGWVDTDMSAEVLHNPKKLRKVIEIIPRGKVATAEDITGAIMFLCSEESNHIIGSSINVNGGGVMV